PMVKPPFVRFTLPLIAEAGADVKAFRPRFLNIYVSGRPRKKHSRMLAPAARICSIGEPERND
ncbi:MAG: hypothetical protein ACK44W_15455, partial [Planctomycetota bacterium]